MKMLGISARAIGPATPGAAVSSALARFDGERWQRIGRDSNFENKRAIAIFLDRDGTLGVFTDDAL